MAKANVEVPVLETLVSGEGTGDSPVHNIVFSGLQFSYATWLAPSSNEGFSEIQATYRLTGPDGWSRQTLGDLVANGTQHFGAWTKTPGNVVADNLIFNHMLILADGGAIYTQGLTGATLAEGEQIEGNVIRDQFGSGHGIYTDNGSCNITITGNVIFHTNFDNWGSRHKDYYNGSDGSDFDPITVTGNYWRQGGADAAEKNITLKGNHLIDSLDHVPPTIIRNAGLEPTYRSLFDKHFGADTAPEPPCRVAAADAGGGSAYVTWSPPVFEGGASAEAYTVTASTGQTATISAEDFRTNGYLKLSGLTGGVTACSFTVTARNANGESPVSLPSRPIALGAASISKPGPPAEASAIVADGRASIHFQSPEDDGGSPVVAYTVTVQPGGRKVTFTGRSVVTLSGNHTMFGVVDGLDVGKSYTFAVAAVNAAGEGAARTTRARGGAAEAAR